MEDNGVIDGTGEPAPEKQEYKGEFADKLIMLDRSAKQLRAERIKKGSVKFESEELTF